MWWSGWPDRGRSGQPADVGGDTDRIPNIGAAVRGRNVLLQIGRNLAGLVLLSRKHGLRLVFERILAWSCCSGALWLTGAFVSSSLRFALWGPALAVDLAAPLLGYRTPGRGRSTTAEFAVEGGHFAERFQAFIIIALGESIVVTGATASARGLSAQIVLALAVAFLGTGALWRLYFLGTAGLVVTLGGPELTSTGRRCSGSG